MNLLFLGLPVRCTQTGEAGFRVMPDNAHDVDLIAVFIDGVAHGLACLRAGLLARGAQASTHRPDPDFVQVEHRLCSHMKCM